MKTDLQGKTALVTGAAAGIGRACARQLAQSGANLVIADLDIEQGTRTAAEIAGETGVRAIALQCDLWEYDSVKRMAEQALRKMGPIALLVASGATTVGYAKFAHEYDPAVDFEGVFRTQMWARLYPVYALLPSMRDAGYGKIVVVTSDAGRTPTPREAFIGACASALITTGKVMAMEWARYGIRINTLCLTIINDSPAMKAVMGTGASHIFQKTFERAKFGVPDPDDAASAALFFCSPETDKITGSVFSVNGGLSYPG